MIYKINTYVDNRMIEIQEREPLDNRLPILYTAFVTIKVNTPQGDYPEQIRTEEFSCDDIHKAFEEVPLHLDKAIKKFQEDMDNIVKEAKEESMGPRIIKPD